MRAAGVAPGRGAVVIGELRKLPAFLRRDFLTMWSYRLAFVSDWLNLIVQIVVFYFVGKLVDPATIPRFGGSRASYMEFVAIGIGLTSFMQIGLGRVVTVIRQEQLMGTLESLLLSPTAPTTIQLGSVIYDVVYVPLRTMIFLTLSAVFFGVHYDVGGTLPAAGILLVFIPFVWGLGVLSAAGVLTFRRGSGIVGLGATIFTIGSGAYFPIEVLPDWAQGIMRFNPVTIALDASRRALLGNAGWREAWPAILALIPAAAASLTAGVVAFRLALNRERRRGTLGLY